MLVSVVQNFTTSFISNIYSLSDTLTQTSKFIVTRVLLTLEYNKK